MMFIITVKFSFRYVFELPPSQSTSSGLSGFMGSEDWIVPVGKEMLAAVNAMITAM